MFVAASKVSEAHKMDFTHTFCLSAPGALRFPTGFTAPLSDPSRVHRSETKTGLLPRRFTPAEQQRTACSVPTSVW